jgi:hypothetical protein
MTNQALAVPWPPCALSEPRSRLPTIAFAASVAALFIVGTAEAKQQCSVSAGSQGYWSWRMIDDRKCWYEGKPKLSKALLEWPAETEVQPDTRKNTAAQPETRKNTANAVPDTHGDPMDAQAYAPAESTSFEALWRDRIEGSRK